MKKKKSILDVKIKSKRVVVRVDFNVSIKEGKIIDDTRIRETIPTLNYLLKNNNTLIILSHLGRPKGIDDNYSLKPIAERLSVYLKRKVILLNHLQESVKKITDNLELGSVVLLENVRFHPGEEKNDLKYARSLAGLGDIFVNDAFAVSHRSHASTVGIAKYLPCFAGLLLSKEITILYKVLHKPNRPVVFLVAGAKISDKIGLIKKELDLSQTVLTGGGIANTFLAAKGINIGQSLIEPDALNSARELLFEAASKHTALILPSDFMVLDKINNKNYYRKINELKDTDAIMDIGKESIRTYCNYILKAGSVILNGPVGKYEQKPFNKGTVTLIKAAAESRALSVIGGGDTLAAIPNKKVAEGITHICTGGGAMLEFIEKGSLPGIDVIEE